MVHCLKGALRWLWQTTETRVAIMFGEATNPSIRGGDEPSGVLGGQRELHRTAYDRGMLDLRLQLVKMRTEYVLGPARAPGGVSRSLISPCVSTPTLLLLASLRRSRVLPPSLRAQLPEPDQHAGDAARGLCSRASLLWRAQCT